MEMKGKHTLQELIQKVGIVRLVVLVLAGIMLLVLSLPQGEKSENSASGAEEETVTESGDAAALQAMYQYARKQEEATEKILSKVAGIGKVQVMLTLASSEEKVTLQDNTVSEDESEQNDRSGGSRKDTRHQSGSENVLVKEDGTEMPYVVQIQSPIVEGVVVVAQGADSSRKEMEIIEAVQALFPVQSHKIKVMKME